jgi:hypothetical protein
MLPGQGQPRFGRTWARPGAGARAGLAPTAQLERAGEGIPSGLHGKRFGTCATASDKGSRTGPRDRMPCGSGEPNDLLGAVRRLELRRGCYESGIRGCRDRHGLARRGARAFARFSWRARGLDRASLRPGAAAKSPLENGWDNSAPPNTSFLTDMTVRVASKTQLANRGKSEKGNAQAKPVARRCP